LGSFAIGGYSYYPNARVTFADGRARHDESHAVLDFMAGKDVGLGMFGMSGSSILSGGIRVAHFQSKSTVHLSGVPDLQYPTGQITPLTSAKYEFQNSKIHFHHYDGSSSSEASFLGLGPAIAWKASAPIAGDESDGELNFDWGANFSVLFGRQRARGQHSEIARAYYLTKWYETGDRSVHHGNPQVGGRFLGPCRPGGAGSGRNFYTPSPCAQTTNTALHNRSRIVAVPNLGVFAGLSMKYRNAKVSFGYRADDFFGAIDGGIDQSKRFDRGFSGPFAKVSVGLGG
jgi:hypothetical protein